MKHCINEICSFKSVPKSKPFTDVHELILIQNRFFFSIDKVCLIFILTLLSKLIKSLSADLLLCDVLNGQLLFHLLHLLQGRKRTMADKLILSLFN